MFYPLICSCSSPKPFHITLGFKCSSLPVSPSLLSFSGVNFPNWYSSSLTVFKPGGWLTKRGLTRPPTNRALISPRGAATLQKLGGSKSIRGGGSRWGSWIRGGVVDGVFRPDFEGGGVVDEVREFEGEGSWTSFPARFRESWQVFWGDPIPKVRGVRGQSVTRWQVCFATLLQNLGGGPIPKVGGVRGQSGTGWQVCFATLLQNFGGSNVRFPKVGGVLTPQQGRIKVFWGPRLDTIVGPHTQPTLPSSSDPINLTEVWGITTEKVWNCKCHRRVLEAQPGKNFGGGKLRTKPEPMAQSSWELRAKPELR